MTFMISYFYNQIFNQPGFFQIIKHWQAFIPEAKAIAWPNLNEQCDLDSSRRKEPIHILQFAGNILEAYNTES